MVTKTYDYDAFGNEAEPSDADTNPFRYCGEYYDTETGTYYLRARYYDPAVGRFTAEDTHWNTANMIYGDNPQKINEREDALGLKRYSYAPQISAVIQSGNLYVYCMGNPVYYADDSGKSVVAIGISVAVATCIADGLITGTIYKFQGKKFGAGFINGFISSFGTELGAAVGLYIGSASGLVVGAAIGSVIGAALGSVAEDLIYNHDKSIEEIVASAAEAAVSGLIASLAGSFIEYAVQIANEAQSAAELLMKYDEKFGKTIEMFFEKMLLLLGAYQDEK